MSDEVTEPAEGADTPAVEPAEGAPAEKAGARDDAAFAAMRRQLESANKQLADYEKAQADRERAEAEQRGEWEKLARQAEQRASELEAQIKRQEAHSLILQAATRAGLKNPEDAAAFLHDQIDGIDARDKAERAIQRLVKDRDYLLAPKAPEPSGLQKVLENGTPFEGTPPNQPGLGPDGKPDLKAALGADILAHLRGGGR